MAAVVFVMRRRPAIATLTRHSGGNPGVKIVTLGAKAGHLGIAHPDSPSHGFVCRVHIATSGRFVAGEAISSTQPSVPTIVNCNRSHRVHQLMTSYNIGVAVLLPQVLKDRELDGGKGQRRNCSLRFRRFGRLSWAMYGRGPINVALSLIMLLEIKSIMLSEMKSRKISTTSRSHP
jgi:hypothetical protein